MPPTRRSVLIGLSAAAVAPWSGCGGRRAPGEAWREEAAEARDRGAAALLGLQSDDGAFRSALYGLLSNGWSLTPFALLALLRAGVPIRQEAASKALGWIAHGTRDGVLGLGSAAPDYPCYATALALSCISIVRPPDPDGLAEALQRGLRSFQLTAVDGWEGHPAHGAFRMGSADRPTPPHPGHVDLSMTRRAVEALVAAGVGPSDPAIRQALRFAEHCRTPSGGFVYTSVETALNKGRREGSDPAYGSATADGLLLGGAAKVEDAARPLALLREMHRVDENPRIGDSPALRPFARAMRGYYRAASARVFAELGGPPGWQAEMVRAVLAEQRPDGTWANERTEQKEDEPIVATGFALIALGAALGA